MAASHPGPGVHQDPLISLPSPAAPGDEDPSHLMGCEVSLPRLPPWPQHKCWFPQDVVPRFFSRFAPQGLRGKSRVWHPRGGSSRNLEL